MNSSFKESGDF